MSATPGESACTGLPKGPHTFANGTQSDLARDMSLLDRGACLDGPHSPHTSQ